MVLEHTPSIPDDDDVPGEIVVHDELPSTDGVAVQPIDQALQGGAPQRVGRFEYHYATDTWTWSDTVARMHGYEPGEVTPTTELVLGHKHPDDLAKVKGLLVQSAAPFSSRHRIITTGGDTRSVVVVGEAVTGPDGETTATRGFYIDITASVDSEIQQTVSEELSVIVAHREVIDQAKGMLQLLYDLDADAAFSVLRWRSQETNVKLLVIAEKLVAELPGLLKVPDGARVPVDHYLMTLQTPDEQ
ncbi:PAS and ANTAR domain-containing protein [Mycolicibacterium sediminis]|uniref:histidine kinase n=1 Tax=Mycolicibacterium sediminis TaxID=1286180 RepID=A0A7I7QSI8_9MYCO|nr:PAS and ANTAR domain-containing protein [Mycolicibacterium sediminis]BBY29020.1 putative transcription antitermination regulator [Mycolicibacterium sediminis]